MTKVRVLVRPDQLLIVTMIGSKLDFNFFGVFPSVIPALFRAQTRHKMGHDHIFEVLLIPPLINIIIIQWRTQKLFSGEGSYVRNFFLEGGSTNSVEDRGQRERGSGGGRPLVRGSAQFANE
jgi:hypothetical protein